MADRKIRHEDVGALAAWDWGPMLVARHLWGELGLESTLDRFAPPARRDAARLSDRALVLVVNRLTAPGSEHAWRAGLRPISCATGAAGAGLRPGAMMLQYDRNPFLASETSQ
jgi:hypothetical protein